jgi:L-iditol 2-dehydrogenase
LASNTTQRALLKTGPRIEATTVALVSRRASGHGEVTLAVLACGICGSDVHAWRQDPGYEWVQTPVVLGHEVVGIVRDVGPGVDPGWVGRRVVPVGINGCGTCRTCQTGLSQICPQRSVLGLSFDGGAAEEVTVRAEHLVEVPADVPPEQIVLVEPTSVALHALGHLGELPAGTRVVVSGPGPIGLLSAWLLDRRGVEVVVTGTRRDEAVRLLAAKRLGLHTVFAEDGALPFTPDAWVEASGSGAGLAQAVASVAPGGTVVVVALFAGAPQLDMNVLVRREVKLLGSYASLAADYRSAARELSRGEDVAAALVTTFPLEEAVSALAATAGGAVTKAVIVP